MTTAAVATRPALWNAGRARLLVLIHAVAVLALVVASLGTRYTGDFGRQSNWTAVAVAGLALGVVASGAWLLGARREVGRRRVRLARAAAAIFALPAAGEAGGDRRVATVVMRNYHRADCLMVRGKDVVAAPVAEHQRAGRTACAVCEG